MCKLSFSLFSLFCCCLGARGAAAAAVEGVLRELIGIDWRRLQDNPTQGKSYGGIEGADGGWLDSEVVLTAFGYVGGRDFLNTAFLKNTSAINSSWEQLPSAPIAGRQNVASTIIKGAVYYVGGFSYSKPFTYPDVVKLAKDSTSKSGWSWTTLPPLPTPLW